MARSPTQRSRDTIAEIDGGPPEKTSGGSFDAYPLVEQGEETATDSFAAYPLVESSGEDKARAFGESATGGALETGGVAAGMVMGAGIGGLGGPAAPLTVPLGAAIGAGAGFLAGQGAKELFGISPVEDLPEDVRPFGVAGEVIGSGAPIAAAPLALSAGARLPPSTVGNFINKILDFAGKSPGTFAAGEAAGLVGAATGGGIAEAFRPGETGPRVAAEIAGGFFNPTRLVIGATKGSLDAARKAIQTMTPAGRETRAAKMLAEIMEEAGEDPALLAQLLRDSDLPGVKLTAGQKTGSPALLALEAKLAAESGKFGADAAKMAEDSLQSIQGMVLALRGTGDPAALSAAADLRARYFRTLLSGRLNAAQREAVEAAGKISADAPDARAVLSRQANESVESALTDARAAESELWAAVPRDLEAKTGNILKRHAELRADLLPEEPLPAVVEGFVNRMNEAGGVTTTGELLRFRSRALALAREAAGQGKANDARIYGRLAEAALDDMDAVFAGPQSGVLRTLGAKPEAYTEARTFSRELHETFTRTFAGDATAARRTGADRIPPEILMRRALGSGKEGGDLRMLELKQATEFMTAKGLGSPEAARNVDLMFDAQQRMLRLAASESIDPATGLVSTARLGKFVRDNSALLNRFPEVKTDLQNALKTEEGRKAVESLVKGSSRIIDRQTAFARVARVESPADAIRAAIDSPTPAGDLRELVKLARRGGPDAVDGLRAAVWDDAIRKSTDASGEISLPKLRAAMLDPVRPGLPSVAQIMEREGVVTAQDITRAGKLFDEAQKIIDAVSKGGAALDALESNPDALFDMVLRIAGAKAGAQMASGTSGATLVAASRGSSFARRIFAKLPQSRVMDVLIEAAKDPKFEAMLLKKPKTQEEGLKLARQIHAYMLQAGLTGLEEEVTEPAQ